MDQISIGRFIAAERKRKGCTQKQLAEKLNISDKTVSKWECGKGFPEVSLLLPLCKELDITVNELLSGARVSEEEYQKKAEENMVNMIKEREENKKKLIPTIEWMSAFWEPNSTYPPTAAIARRRSSCSPAPSA